VLIFLPFFHRDDTRLPCANSFAPELWLERHAYEDWPLIPFSAGPGECAGRNLVLLVTSSLIAAFLEQAHLRLPGPVRLVPGALPATLSPFGMRFSVSLQ
jgi:cytochrome P450